MIRFIDSLIVFCISPILSLLLAIKNVFSNKKQQYVIALFFSLFGAFLPPISDAYRYRLLYYSTNSISFDTLSAIITQKKDFFFEILCYTFNSIGFSFEFFKFVLLCICYFLYCSMFQDIAHRNRIIHDDKSIYLWSFYSIIFSIRFFTLTNGIRFGFASTIIVVAIYYLVTKRHLKSLLLFLTACFTHYSMWAYVGIIIVAYLIHKLNINKLSRVVLIILLLLTANSSIGSIISYVFPNNEIMERSVDVYIDGAWGTESLTKTASMAGLIFTYIRIMPIIPLGYFIIKDERSSFIKEISFVSLLFLCISTSSITLLLRYSNMTAALMIICFLMNLNDAHIKTKLKSIFITILIVFFSYAYSQRTTLLIFGPHYKAIISPITLIFDDKYSDKWVKNNINEEGEYKIN